MSAFAESDENEPYTNFIFDPVGLENDLSLLAPLFKDSNIVKIFHSCEDDIKLLKKDFGFEIENNFDTHLAAKYLSLKDSLSLQALVKKLYDVQLDKKWQKADWRIRPLDEKQLDYAINDTIFLNGIRNYLIPQLAEKQLSEEFTDHCQMMTSVEYKERFDLEQMWVKFARKSKIPRHARSFLKAFYNHRLRLARKTDIAGFRLFPEIHLVDLTLDIADIETDAWTNESIEDVLLSSYGEYHHFIQDLEDLVTDLNWALENPELDYPHSPETKLTPSESKQLRGIQEYKGKMAERRGFEDPSLIFPKKNAVALLKTVIRDPFGELSKTEMNDILGWSDYKHDLYEDELRKLEKNLRNKYQARANGK